MYRQADDPGFGERYFNRTKRIINKDGSFNVKRTHSGFNISDIYHYLITADWSVFLLLLSGFFIFVNILFAVAYSLIGIHNLEGHQEGSPFLLRLLNSFFFSIQTFTTVGYGGILPGSILSNLVASFEAMSGLMGFALATGLLYGRFSKPSSKIVFSDKAIIAPFRDGKSLQFRIANKRSNVLMNLEARLLLMLIEKSGAEYTRRYFNLNLDLPFISFFPLSWTVVHPINEESPLLGKSYKDLEEQDAEILILIKGFDESFNQDVHVRYSYRFDEIIWNARYKRAFTTDEDGEVILKLDMISDYELIK
ncbi:MAG TPA: ion channel [Ignavibacteriaceae bacterium]|nr:ion channel [Ignavibacteriaceae bacterium]